MDLTGFIAHVATMTATVHQETHHALEHAAKVVEKEVKAEIGSYQGKAGQFAAWAELADATKADRVRHGFNENDPLLRTGELRDSIGHMVEVNGAAGHAVVGSNSDIAVFQELGTARIPPRSFLGGAAFRKADEVADICGEGAVRALVGPQVFRGRLPIP